MPITDKVNRTIKCEGPDCKNEISFDPQNAEAVANLPTWLRTTRTIQLGNRQQFLYCSDVCEVKGVTTGNHNVKEQSQVQTASEADVRAAAAQAAAAQEANQALKEGTIKLTDN